MIEVISVKFKSRGKCYFFSPGELSIPSGEKVIVETSKGIEIADCVRGNHNVPDEAVVPPLRPVIRIATAEDRRTEEQNRRREQEAYKVCQQKIAEHGLEMKLVDVECNFDGSKTLFFFTSDGRVDFRELVKDLAGIFRNRIELRQIGVRDEAKMIGGIGICGRPYCCNRFLDDFQPVSTKMAKLQSLSLNPTKISGSCGRLMCCLRYEQEAYEDLVKKVPKTGAFVETKDGFGTAVQVNLLRQTVQVKLDNDGDDSARTYKANELCTVPGGRPKDGEAPVSTFVYVPEPEEDQEPDITASLIRQEDEISIVQPHAESGDAEHEKSRRNGRHRSRNRKGGNEAQKQPATEAAPQQPRKSEAQQEKTEGRSGSRRHRGNRGHDNVKTVKVEAKPAREQEGKAPHETVKPERKPQKNEGRPQGQKAENRPQTQKADSRPQAQKPEGENGVGHDKSRYHRGNHRRYHGGKSGQKPQGENRE